MLQTPLFSHSHLSTDTDKENFSSPPHSEPDTTRKFSSLTFPPVVEFHVNELSLNVDPRGPDIIVRLAVIPLTGKS